MLHTWHYTDWMYRPRLPAELDVQQGGGPVFRQASHQVDIVRYIAGGLVKSVRAMVVQLDTDRHAPGAYTAYLEFADGTPATIVYSGYGRFGMSELIAGEAAPVGQAPRVPRPQEDEAAAKEALRYSAPGTEASAGVANVLGLFGLTLVSCEGGDLRESPDGLYLYQRGGRQAIHVADELRGAAELEEMYQAVRFGRPIVHNGRWGEATLEVCLAIHESARTQSEVFLSRQTALTT
jgi:phthalate 4,5-cis-dihydrodiol dehydrogenase